MNSQSVQLLSVLSKCNPNDKQLSLELKIQSILRMDSYVELAHRSVFKEAFDNLFAEDRLRSYDEAKLNKIIDALPWIPDCLDNIIFSLKNGDCSQLSKADVPKYFDKNALMDLSARLENSSGKNYCNIDPDDYMAIFDEKTIKSIEPYYGQLPYGCEDYGPAIEALLSTRKYCINENEIMRLSENFKAVETNLLSNIENAEQNQFKFSLIKLLVCLVCTSMPSLYSQASGNISDSMVMLSSVVVAALSVVYYLKG